MPEYESWLIEAMRSGPESPFWHKKGMSVVDHVADYADVPVLHITGWYDSWTRQVTMNYEALSRAKKSPQKLVIGPWTHGGQNSNTAGEVEFTREAGINLLAFRLRWYDRWLKDDKNGVDDDPAGAAVRHGHRRRPPLPRRAAPARRLLARRARVAPGTSPGDHALHVGRRHSGQRACPNRNRHTPPTRSTHTIPCRPSAATSPPTRDS